MIRQSIIYLILSILIVIFAKYAHLLIIYLDMLYTYLNVKLSVIFSTSELGVLFRNILILVFLPLLIAAVPALIYRAIKGRVMPYFFQITWLIWLVIVLSKVLIR